MRNRMLNRWGVLLAGLVIVALSADSSILSAAPKAKDGQAADDTSAKSGTPRERTTAKIIVAEERAPRMPAHFNKVIDESQRAKIVEILNEYSSQIEQKRQELEALTGERDKALFGVLTPKQRKEVEALRAESLAKRKASASDEDTDDEIGSNIATSPKGAKAAE